MKLKRKEGKKKKEEKKKPKLKFFIKNETTPQNTIQVS